MVITRKIEINIDIPEKEERVKCWETIRKWRDICHKAANHISTHLFVQDALKELFYYTDDLKFKLAAIAKDENGMFDTSAMNTTYRVLSKKFKGDIPTAALASLNKIIRQTYNTEKKDILFGNRSLRTYRKTIPIPLQAKSFRSWNTDETQKNYTFTILGIPFKTFFGRDRSNNKIVIERALAGEYKLCDSSIMLDDTKGKKPKLFILLVVDIPKKDLITNPDRAANACLTPIYPIEVNYNGVSKQIGTKDEFNYRRIQIQAKLRKLFIELRYANGGKGRTGKLQAIKRYHKLEKNYITTKLHTYSKMLVDFAIENQCGVINLVDLHEQIEKAKEDKVIIRNWSYYGLVDMIKYKAQRHNIAINVL